jgi:hypothetical protein
VLQSEDSYISSNRPYWAFYGVANAIKSVCEDSGFATYCKMGPGPEEGGRIKSKKNCPGQALHHYGSGQAPNLVKVRILVVFLKTTSVLVCSQGTIQLTCMREN